MLVKQNKASIDHVTPHHIYASSASFLKGPLLSRYELGYSLIKLKPALELQKELNSTAELSECYGVHLSKNVNEAVLEEFESKIWSLIEEDKSSCFYASSEISAHKDRLRKTFGDQMVFSRQSCSDATLKCVQETLVDLFVLLNTSWFLGSPLTPYSQLAALVIGEIWYPGQGK